MNPAREPATLPGHFPRLDVLRAYAILLVFLMHFVLVIFGLVLWNGSTRDYGQWPFSYGFVPAMYGWTGVALFFVISGFCIHYAFLHSGPDSFSSWRFFWRRFTRLYPAYFVSLVFFIIFIYLLNPAAVTVQGIITHLLLIHNLSPDDFVGINGVYWSLGVECQFYLLYPLLLLGRKKYGLPSCLAASLALNVFCDVLFWWLSPNPEYPVDFYRSFPLVTWCTWILGACLAEAYVTRQPVFVHKKFFAVLALGLFLLAENFRPLIGEAFLFASVFFGVLMQDYAASPKPLNILERCLIPLGLVSYSFYLWHAPLITPLRKGIHLLTGISDRVVPLVLLVYLPVMFLILLLISMLSHYLLEVRARRWLMGRSRSVASIPVSSAALAPE